MPRPIAKRNYCWSQILRRSLLATFTTCVACMSAAHAQTRNIICVDSNSSGGGAVINYGSNAEFTNVTFSSNRTNGGGVWVDDQASQYGGTRPVFSQSNFEENQAGFIGGGIHNFNATTTVMDRTALIDNKADVGNNIANTLNSRVTMRENTVDPETVYTDDSSRVNSPR